MAVVLVLSLFYLYYGWFLYRLCIKELLLVLFIYAFFIRCFWVVAESIPASALNEKGVLVILLKLFELYDDIKFK